MPHGRRLMSHDRCLVPHDGSGSESENADEIHAHVCTRHHHHGRIDEASDEEEEEDEEDEEEEEEEEEIEECDTDEEVNMHMRVVNEADENRDDLSDYSAEEGDELLKAQKTEQEEECGNKGRQHKLAQCKKLPKQGMVQRPHGDSLSSTPKRRGQQDCCSHRHHVKGSPAQLNVSQGNQSVDSMKHGPCTSGVSSKQPPQIGLYTQVASYLHINSDFYLHQSIVDTHGILAFCIEIHFGPMISGRL